MEGISLRETFTLVEFLDFVTYSEADEILLEQI
jgi:hypothetical protein